MKEAFDTVKGILSPEDNWSKFAMKITGLAVVAGIGFFGFNTYQNSLIQEEDEYEMAIEEVFEEDPEKKELVLSFFSDSFHIKTFVFGARYEKRRRRLRGGRSAEEREREREREEAVGNKTHDEQLFAKEEEEAGRQRRRFGRRR